MSKIKVDVISGFLGAGKTTLLSKYVAYRIKKGEKLAIIENEFGEVGIDGLFLENQGLSVHEIVNGCICCSLKGNILLLLKDIASRGEINRVVIEPTGIFMLNEIYGIISAPGISSNYEMGAVVTIVDAKNYLSQKRKYNWFFSNQIKYAHLLVLSKTGMVDRDTILVTIQSVQEISDAPDVVAKDWDAFTKDDWERIFAGNNKVKTEGQLQYGCEQGEESTHEHGDGHEGFAGISVPCSRSFSEHTLKATIRMLSSGVFGDIPRAKGIVADESKGSLEFDYVNGDVDIRHRTELVDISRISFIGTGIQKSALSLLFNDPVR